MYRDIIDRPGEVEELRVLAITGGTVVASAGTYPADVLIDGEKIVALGNGLGLPEGARTIDATDCLVLPGVVDCHVHFDLVDGDFRTRDTFLEGSRAAAAGGVTCYIDYVSQQQDASFADAIGARRAEADGRSLVDYSLHFHVTDLDHGQTAELPHLVDHGVSSIKIYTTYKNRGLYVDDWTWYSLLRHSRECGLLIEAHCENDDIVTGARAWLVAEGKTALRYHGLSRPAISETEAVYRGLCLARAAGAASYYVHQSSADSVDAVVAARLRGQPAIAETCPHFLVLTDEAYDGDEPERFIMIPPLRDAANAERLWDHISSGHISCIGTDHCGYPLDQRLACDDFTRVSPGVPGTELLLPLLHSEGVLRGRISLRQLVALISTNAARIFGLAPDKGELRPGADADAVIFDPAARWTVTAERLVSAAGYTPYEGMEIVGRVRATVSRGTVVFEDDSFPAENGHGRFVKRRPYDADDVLE